MKKAMKQSTLVLILNALSILALLIASVLYIITAYTNNASAQAQTDRFSLTENANRFMNGSSYLTSEVRAYAATGDITHYNNYWNEINNLKNRDTGVQNMKDIGITTEELSLITEMSDLSNTLVPLESAAQEQAAAGLYDDALDYVYGREYSDAITKINTLKTTFLEKLEQRTQAEVDRLTAAALSLQIASFVALALVAALQVFNNVIIRRKIISPIIQVEEEMLKVSNGILHSDFAMEPDSSEIGQLVNAVQTTKAGLCAVIDDIGNILGAMAAGNMNQEITANFPNDFLPLKQSLETILSSLNHTLMQIYQTSHQVSASAEQVSESSQSLARGASEQTSAVEDLSSTISEISQQIEKITAGASTSRTQSYEASKQLALGNEKMGELNEAMNRISSASNRIGGIIKTIEDIAFQTNILALNAAVEASRAGVAGKGFAVVADEVRSLADKSSTAAKDSALLIEQTLKLVADGTTLAKETSEDLALLVEGARLATHSSEQVAEETTRQAEALHEVTRSLDKISNVVQTNAAAAEESAASAEELSGQAETQRDLVSQFQLKVSQNAAY